jgi:hypothetical protein
MMEVAEKDFEMDAILKIQSLVSGVLFSRLLVPNDWA